MSLKTEDLYMNKPVIKAKSQNQKSFVPKNQIERNKNGVFKAHKSMKTLKKLSAILGKK